MRTLLIPSLFFAATLLAAQQLSAPEAIEPPIAPPASVPPPPTLESEEDADGEEMPEPSVPSDGTGRVNEFQSDEVSLVLRTLARQVGANLVLSDRAAKE